MRECVLELGRAPRKALLSCNVGGDASARVADALPHELGGSDFRTRELFGAAPRLLREAGTERSAEPLGH
jgi:hypothetical protein